MTIKDLTIVLPVYGRPKLLKAALESVVEQTRPDWKLLIADDGSDIVTRNFIEEWIEERGDQRIRWICRPQNIGLFANLNDAIEGSEASWFLLLCSDDVLLPSAVERIQELNLSWPQAGLILSTFESINLDGSCRNADSALHHDKVSRETSLLTPQIFIPALLRLGSLNGNLTGMAFNRDLWHKAGPFRSDWRHASDWEWLIRASENGTLILNRTPIARVRTHKRQLSNNNRRSGHELDEVAAVVELLYRHPLLAGERRRHRWAAHVMQHQLWNLFKQLINKDTKSFIDGLKRIQSAAGLRMTFLSLVRFTPHRLHRWLGVGGSNDRTHEQ